MLVTNSGCFPHRVQGGEVGFGVFVFMAGESVGVGMPKPPSVCGPTGARGVVGVRQGLIWVSRQGPRGQSETLI
jgi:hypothetical protein